MNMMSEQVDQLFTALAKAQGEFTVAAINKVNPHFKSKYSDLQSYFAASRPALSKHGLAVIQTIEEVEGRSYLLTTLGHTSGQWIRSRMPINPVKNDMQGFGSALSYAKRYSLGAIIGLASGEEDDDGNDAVATNGHHQELPKPQVKENCITQEQLGEFVEIFNKCDSEFQKLIMDTLKKPPHNAKTLAEMPANIYEKVLSSAKERLANAKRGEKHNAKKETVNA